MKSRWSMCIRGSILGTVSFRWEWKLREGVSSPSVADTLIGMGFAPSHVDLAIRFHGEDIDSCIQFILTLQASANTSSVSFTPSSSISFDSHVSSLDSILLCMSDEELPSLTDLETVQKDCFEANHVNDPNMRYFGNNNNLFIFDEDCHFMDYLWNSSFRYDYWNKHWLRTSLCSVSNRSELWSFPGRYMSTCH